MRQPPLSVHVGKTRVVLLCGFLGSGKTTLVNYILKSNSNLSSVVVIVNEFGKLGIDKEIIMHQENEIVELTSGCICCTLVMDLKKCLLETIQRHKPRILLIEASGVADPYGVKKVFDDLEIQQSYFLEKTVTVLDADCWRIRSVFGELFFRQLQTANLILLNKTDLMEQKTLKQTIQQLGENYPHAHIVPTTYSRVELETMIGKQGKTSAVALPDGISTPVSLAYSENRPLFPGKDMNLKVGKMAFSTFSFEEDTPLDKNALIHLLNHLPIQVFRIKGLVKFKSHVESLNHVGGRSHWTKWRKKSETRLVIIGWGLDKDAILTRLKNCLTTGDNQ